MLHRKVDYTIGLMVIALFLLTRCDQQEFLQAPTLTTRPAIEIDEEPVSFFQRVEFAQWNSLFQFSGEIPHDWEVEYVPEIEALNIYDPLQAALPARELSQMFIRHFKADRFLTLSTVDLFLREERTVRGHAAVNYEIAKKPGVADFPHQPSWRNERHKLTDIRYTKSNPSEFFVFAYNPAMSTEVFEAFLDSLRFHNDASSFMPPLDRISERVNKKPFGLKISPESSPVQPERFSGYHTGVDFEVFPEEADRLVEVHAICGGKLRIKRSTQGYGGVAVQDCSLNDESITVVYGHLNAMSIPEAGRYLAPGDVIGALGQPPDQTDGERKHLHLGFHRGSATELKGYVPNESELKRWANPCEIICR